ncbi:hypothetical protein AVEN_274355-1 [Araneus ventricosus]|uniref:Uncharacterized protein n=1 Tax=Araneus ventricosus TaxID=182803 RepID=A0A4Y2G8X2_ARAVE|nr:hypothetical protein AVEN_274355-1 [Araneus ventricosus]
MNLNTICTKKHVIYFGINLVILKHHWMTRTTPKFRDSSPYFHTTSARRLLNLDVRFDLHQVHIHHESLVKSGFESVRPWSRSRDRASIHQGGVVFQTGCQQRYTVY